MKRIISAVLAALLMTATTLVSVEYDGEKTYLFEVPYKVCPIAPLPKEAKAKGITVVTTDEAIALYKKGGHFYDARRPVHYNEGRIKGAKPVFFDVSKAHYTVLSLPADDKTPLVFYCYGETCANSYEAALAVKEFGYKNIYWYAAGYAAWQGRNQPTEK